jgi:hypothetical protein
MQLLLAGVDRSVIALLLGHESVETTQMYLNADLELKERILARVSPYCVESSLQARRPAVDVLEWALITSICAVGTRAPCGPHRCFFLSCRT